MQASVATSASVVFQDMFSSLLGRDCVGVWAFLELVEVFLHETRLGQYWVASSIVVVLPLLIPGALLVGG